LLTTVAELLADTFENCDAAIFIRNANGAFDIGTTTTADKVDRKRIQVSAHQGIIRDALDARSSVLGTGNDAIEGSHAELVLPLISVGETLGVIVLSSSAANVFSSDDRSIAQATADVCATAIRNVQLADELRRVTNTDPLTGLFNQRYLHFAVGQELSRAKRFGSDFAVAALDLKRFREVNSAQGFPKGDELLKRTAAKLRSSLRAVDTVCRYEADTFVVVLPEISGTHAQSVVTKLMVAVEEAQKELLGSSSGAICAVAAFPADGNSELHILRSLINKLHENSARAAATS
jgi:diguanylate cyclase (GGDEF)-like protein